MEVSILAFIATAPFILIPIAIILIIYVNTVNQMINSIEFQNSFE